MQYQETQGSGLGMFGGGGGAETIFLWAGCGFHRGDRVSTPGLRTASTQRYCPLSSETCAKLVSSKGRARQRALPVERSPLKTLTADGNWRMYPGLQSKLVVTLTITSINQPDWLTGYWHQPPERSSPEEVARMRSGDYRERRWLLQLATQCLLYWWLILVSLGELFQNVHDVSDNSNS